MLRVSIPATSANLGPAFDCVGIAFDIRMEAYATRRPGPLRLKVEGEEAPTHSGFVRRIRNGMSLVCQDLNELSLSVKVKNDIPLGVGLGSSAAALICGIVLAAAAKGHNLTPQQIAGLAARAEGHADNAAAAVFGSICFVLNAESGLITSILGAPPDLRFALVVPSASLRTSHARSVLPRAYDRADVVGNLQRTAILAVALARGDVQALIPTLADRLHEPYRAALVPGVAAALRERDATLGVVLSGSGPSVLVLTTSGPAAAGERVARHFRHAGIEARVLLPRVDESGLVIDGTLADVGDDGDTMPFASQAEARG